MNFFFQKNQTILMKIYLLNHILCFFLSLIKSLNIYKQAFQLKNLNKKKI
jgi:hypothetical protein